MQSIEEQLAKSLWVSCSGHVTGEANALAPLLDDELGRRYTPALYYKLRNFQEPLDHIHC